MPRPKNQNGYTFSTQYILRNTLPEKAYQVIGSGMFLVSKVRFLFVLMESNLATDRDRIELHKEISYIAGLADGICMTLSYLCPLYDPQNPDKESSVLWRRSLIYLHDDYHKHVITGGRQAITDFEGNTRRKINKALFREEMMKSFDSFADMHRVIQHLETVNREVLSQR